MSSSEDVLFFLEDMLVDDGVFILVADVNESYSTVFMREIRESSNVILDVHKVVLLEKFPRVSVDCFKLVTVKARKGMTYAGKGTA